MRLIEASGSPREVGQQTGEQLRDEIREHLEIISTHRNLERWQAALPAFVETSQRYTPAVFAEMEGTAEGANLAPEDIFALNFPLYANELVAAEGCTNIAFAEGPDGPIWGKNNDGLVNQCHLPACARLIRRDGSLPLVTFTFCGMIATLDGMNAAGLAMGHSSVGSVFQQSDRHPQIRHWGYEGMLTCRTTAEFVEHLASCPCRDKGYSILCVDRQGVTCSLEAPVPLVQVRRPGSLPGHMNCVNCYQLPALQNADRRTPEGKANAYARQAFLERWVAESDDFSLSAMQGLLRRHEYPEICRHRSEDGCVTEYSMIGLPESGRVLYCGGNPCEREYEVFEF